jgi:hypothetical protein
MKWMRNAAAGGRATRQHAVLPPDFPHLISYNSLNET